MDNGTFSKGGKEGRRDLFETFSAARAVMLATWAAAAAIPAGACFAMAEVPPWLLILACAGSLFLMAAFLLFRLHVAALFAFAPFFASAWMLLSAAGVPTETSYAFLGFAVLSLPTVKYTEELPDCCALCVAAGTFICATAGGFAPLPLAAAFLATGCASACLCFQAVSLAAELEGKDVEKDGVIHAAAECFFALAARFFLHPAESLRAIAKG